MIWHRGRWACGYCEGMLCVTEEDGVRCLICGRDVLMTTMAEHIRLRTLMDEVMEAQRSRPIGPGRPTTAMTVLAAGKPRERALAVVMEQLGTFTSDDIERAFPALQHITVQGYCRVCEVRGLIARVRTASTAAGDRTLYRWVGSDATARVD